MVRCTACDLELDGGGAPCPECGAPTHRPVTRVDMAVRDRYDTIAVANASADADFEYAFGGKRSHLRASTAPAREKRPKRIGLRRRRILIVDEPAAVEREIVPDAAKPIDVPDAIAPVDDADNTPVGVHDLLDAVQDEAVDVNDDDDETVSEAGDDVEPEPELDADDEPTAGGATELEPPETADEKPEIEVRLVPYVDLRPRMARTATRPAGTSVVHRGDVERVEDAEPTVQRRSPRRRLLGFAALLGLVGAGAVGVIARPRPDAGPPPPPRRIGSATDPVSFLVPGTWQLESQGKGVVSLADPETDAHVHATLIARKALPEALSLKARVKQVRSELVRELEDADVSTPASVRIGKLDAIRTELTATSVGRPVAYIHTVVKTPKHFINVLAWVPAERMGAEREALLDIVESLRT